MPAAVAARDALPFAHARPQQARHVAQGVGTGIWRAWRRGPRASIGSSKNNNEINGRSCGERNAQA
nr:oxidoreductase [Burkholderia pseudomallei]